ncbi:MAG: hypothetical protein K0R10_1410 [Alphaproteobacteria bacterium]|jgi:hypothetical protein|nr:hypothetical protein [Alphaproteobacteria bacterium]
MVEPALSGGLPAALYMLATLGVCQPESAPKLEFTLGVEKPEWSYAKTSAEMKRELPPMSKQFPVVGGYTHSTTRDKYHVSFIHKKDRLTGMQCVWPEKVTVTVSYTADIYVAKNYPRGGCRDIETRAHEKRHVAADVDVLEGGMGALRARVEKIIRQPVKAGPVDEKGAARIRGALLGRIKDAVQDELKRLEKLRKKRHAKIDSVAEYTRMTKACRR